MSDRPAPETMPAALKKAAQDLLTDVWNAGFEAGLRTGRGEAEAADPRQQWRSIQSIPIDRIVEVKSVSGIICLAKVKPGASVSSRGSVSCSRRDVEPRGEVQAVLWRNPLLEPRT